MAAPIVVPKPLIKTGQYTGDGTDNRAITVGFQPDVVLIRITTAVNDSVFKTKEMASGYSMLVRNSQPLLTTRIKDFTATGFTIGTNGDVNATGGHNYIWIALADNGSGTVATGTYTGNATDGNAVTMTPAFQPDYILASGDYAMMCAHAYSALQVDPMTFSFNVITNYSEQFMSFNANGFTVNAGTGYLNIINQVGTIYYFALKATAGLIQVLTYTGDSTTGREIATTVDTDFIMLDASDVNLSAIVGGKEFPAGYSTPIYDQVKSTNFIRQMSSRTFTINNYLINDNAKHYYALVVSNSPPLEIYKTNLPTFYFTATDGDGDTLQYNVQIDTVDTFDSNAGSPIIDKVSTTDSGFPASPPYTQGVEQSFTVQSADSLSNGTYYWRFRAIDPGGSNTYSPWNPTAQFTVVNEPDTLPRILPFGDSITYGAWVVYDMGYRDHLQDLLGIGKYNFVGSYSYPTVDATYDVDHSGVVGQLTSQLLARLPAELTTWMTGAPVGSKVLIHGGTNDVTASVATATIVSNVQGMIDTVHAFNPVIAVYVAKIVSSRNRGMRIRDIDYNAALETMVSTYQATKKNLYLVDMFAAFYDNPTWWSDYMVEDNHPNDAGYTVMARVWFDSFFHKGSLAAMFR